MEQRDIQRIEHILDYCDDIENAVQRFGKDFDCFRTDKAYHDLICFYLLQIGEMAGQLSTDFQAKTSDVMDWGLMKGMRNVVAHHYGVIRLDIVWNTIIEDIPV